MGTIYGQIILTWTPETVATASAGLWRDSMSQQFLATFSDRSESCDVKIVVLAADSEDEAKDLSSEIAQITGLRSGAVVPLGKKTTRSLVNESTLED